MRRRLGAVLLLAFVLLLALGVAHRAQSLAHTRQRITTDRAVFARYAEHRRGSFAKVTVTPGRRADLACARLRAHSYRICIVVRGDRLVRAYEKVAS